MYEIDVYASIHRLKISTNEMTRVFFLLIDISNFYSTASNTIIIINIKKNI